MYFYISEPEIGTAHQLVVGKDKFENDLLIKYGFRELNYMWFHADKYSSGHVYLRMHPDEKELADVPHEVVNDCLQLCKSESIQGNKLPQCTIIYTPWHNLRKNRFMKPGEVSFKSLKYCKRKECFARDNKILNRLTKTRIEVLENVESLLHEAKKSRDSLFFVNYINQNRDTLIEAERTRKSKKKQAKTVKSNDIDLTTM